MSKMRVRSSGGPIGAEITGIDLTEPMSEAGFREIDAAINRHSVVVIRDQMLPQAALVAFARRFGQPQINVRAEVNSAALPEVFHVSNVTKDGKPLGSRDAGRYWHSDLCYLERPSSLTLLNGLEVPERDGVVYGDTLFISAAAAYDALPDETKRRLAGLRASNSYRTMWNRKAREFGKRAFLSEAELAKYPPDVDHPIVRTHPVTGRKCLYVCDGYTNRIADMPEAAGAALLKGLFEHLQNPAFLYRHKWRAGDLLIWDNCAVQHKAVFDYEPPLRRVMQRCTIEGTAPF
jgi:alpha-ketoglutarate-dependent taurine dioxygenase